MPKSYQVQIAVSGVAQAAQQVKSVATATQQVAAANQKLAQQVAAANSSFARLSPSVSPALRVPMGPAQRFASAQVNAYQALQVGTHAQVFDTQAALQRAQAAYQKVANPAGPAAPAAAPSLGSRIASAVYSSRFGMGGGVMPLVGQTANALGINLRGMLATPAGMAASAIIALGVAASKAAEHVDALAREAFLSGGSAGQVGGLQRFGISDVAGAAGGLRGRAASDPFAMMAAQRLGVGIPLPRPFGGTNEAQYYRQVADALRNVHDKEEQLRLVRMLQVPELEHLLRVSEGLYQSVNRIDTPAQSQIYDAMTGQASADTTTGLGRAGESVWDEVVAIFKPLIPVVSLVTNLFADLMEPTAAFIDLFTGPLADLFQLISSGTQQAIAPFFGGIMHMLHWLRWFERDPIGTLTGKHASELDENTSALNQNTAAMKAGIHGGGPRLAGAMPGNLRGEALRQMMNAGQVRLGAF